LRENGRSLEELDERSSRALYREAIKTAKKDKPPEAEKLIEHSKKKLKELGQL
jgi:cellobiose-specific phosphotransferase system component IIA